MARLFDDQEPPNLKAANDSVRRDDSMEDEEKILSGRDDVNMPALLTKDSKGG